MLLAVAACKPAPTIAYDDFASRQVAAQCTRLVRCGLFESSTACLAFFKLVPNTSLDAAVTAGKVHYDGEAANGCVNALAGITCDGSTEGARLPPAVCAEVFTGDGAIADPCFLDSECDSGRCALGSNCDPSACCAGTCAVAGAAAIGDACNITADCVAGSYCTIDKVCVAFGNQGDNCYIDADCVYGLACSTATFPGTCYAAAADGQPCPNGLCAEIGDHCNASKICEPVGLTGAPCTGAADCSPYGVCDAGSGLCADAPDIGSPCSERCEADAFCDAPSGTCIALFADGAICDTNNDCVSSFCEDSGELSSCEELPVCD